MKLYDENIVKLQQLLAQTEEISEAQAPWPLSNHEELILKSDMYLELGGGACHAANGMAFTTSEKLVPKDGIRRINPCSSLEHGKQKTQELKPELQEVKEKPEEFHEYPQGTNLDYARFTLIRLKEQVDEKKTQELYTLFRKIDYLRYHMFLQGVSLRITSSAHREVLRISKEAVKNKINAESIMNTFLKEYKKTDLVEAVQIYYFTGEPGEKKEDSKIFWTSLEQLARSCEDITESLNVIFKGLNMDCSTCGQKEICDTVDGMRELHEKWV